jgi:hypothetical protein
MGAAALRPRKLQLRCQGHVVSKVFETGKTRGLSRALRECGGMRGEWIEMSVGRWRESGFIS